MRKIKYWILILILGLAHIAIAQDTLLQVTTISSGGGLSGSPSFAMMNTIGQPITGMVPSTSYQNGFGFWNVQEELLNYYASPYSVFSGWNMVSIPKVVTDYHKHALFPTAISNAFAYEGSYKTIDSLMIGNGYWVKFGSTQTISYPGLPINTDSINVTPNWNIIGSVSDAIPVGSIVQIPAGSISSQYFGYNGAYYIASTIEPGNAYWVKSRNVGKLVLGSSINALVSQQMSKQEPQSNDLNVLTVQSSASSTQKQELYFGTNKVDSSSSEQYELPPVPPAGGVDARFATNKYMHNLPSNLSEPVEVPVRLQSDGKPLKISWNLKDVHGIKYSLLERKGNQLLSTHKMGTTGSFLLGIQEGINYYLRAENVPQQFALLQNYPNPFNPSTTIRFDLPVPSNVTITIFNVLGQRVMTPIDNQLMEEGQKSSSINLVSLASGAYFYRLDVKESGSQIEFHSVKKMILLK